MRVSQKEMCYKARKVLWATPYFTKNKRDSPMSIIIETKNLTKKFGDFIANNNINIQVEREINVLLVKTEPVN